MPLHVCHKGGGGGRGRGRGRDNNCTDRGRDGGVNNYVKRLICKVVNAKWTWEFVVDVLVFLSLLSLLLLSLSLPLPFPSISPYFCLSLV